jgi:hypothetical protein
LRSQASRDLVVAVVVVMAMLEWILQPLFGN